MSDLEPPRDELEGRLDSLAGALAGLEGRFELLTAEVASLGPKLNELLDRHPAGLGAASTATRDLAHDAAVDALAPATRRSRRSRPRSPTPAATWPRRSTRCAA